MAYMHGKDGTITVGGNALIGVTEWSYNETSTLHDTSDLGDANMTYTAGQKDGTVNVSGLLDEADADQATIRAGASITFELQPEGTGIGDIEWSGSGVIESFEITGQKGDMVGFSVTAKGVLTEGTV